MSDKLPTTIDSQIVDRLRSAIRTERLLDTAVALIEVPSPTRSARAVSDRLADLLHGDGFPVERPAAGWPESPAVVARYKTGRNGRTLQFNGHLDTVHLPFVPPRIENGMLYGSGATDMKGGVAAMVEAMRILRDTQLLPSGGILLTAHDLHESPWGDGGQLNALVDAGFVGDGVLLPEYFCDQIPVIGRGLMILEIAVRRDGVPVHEVLGGIDQPSVIRAGAEIVRRLAQLDSELARRTHPQAGRESLFVGCVAAGEIYNQSPVEFHLSGTRRWLPGRQRDDVERELRTLLDAVAAETGTHVDAEFHFTRDAFSMDASNPLVDAFQSAYLTTAGRTLPIGAKPFVDDGNTFVSRAGIPAITHGPGGTGAHTLNEEVRIAELERTALVYALTAITFCSESLCTKKGTDP